jgi:Ca2+-binding RTX toxin-like protein
MFTKKRRLQGIGLGLLLCGACACDAQAPSNGFEIPDHGLEGVATGHIDLLAARCNDQTSPTNVVVTLGSNETAYFFLRTTDNKVVSNSLSLSTGGECAFSATDTISVQSGTTSTNHKVVLDYYTGVFGVATSGSAVGTTINLTGGSNNTLEIRGTPYADLVTFGVLSGTDYGQFLAGTTTTSAPSGSTASGHTFPDMSFAGVTSLVVSLGPGNDVITGSGGTQLAKLGTTTYTNGATPLPVNMTVYGGDGNDTITSGAAGTHNSLNGNKGNDVFLQQLAKASDVITGSDPLGGDDYDTVDYSIRTGAVFVTLGDTGLTSTPSATILCTKVSDITANDTFTIFDSTTSTAFEYILGSSVGQVTFPALAAAMHNHDKLTVLDGVTTTVYEYKMDASFGSATAGAIVIDAYTANALSGNDLANLTYAKMNTQQVNTVMALDPGAGLSSTQYVLTVVNATETGGLSPTLTASNADFTTSAMSSGTTSTPTPHGFAVVPVYVAGAVQNAANKHTEEAAEVAELTAAAITAANHVSLTLMAGLSSTPATSSGDMVTITLDPGPIGSQSVTKTTTTANFVVTDFTVANGGVAFGANDGEAGEGDDIDATIENIIGGYGNDTLDASLYLGKPHVLQGMAGNDKLIGADKADTLYGGPGDDILIGGKGADTLIGGDGNDTLQGGLDSDIIDGGGLNCVQATTAIPSTAAPWGSSVCTATFMARNSSSTTVSNATNPGLDTLDYSDRTTGVTVNLSTSTAMFSGTTSTPITTGATLSTGIGAEVDEVYQDPAKGGTTAIISVSNIRGGTGDDILTGDDNPNIIWGGGGNDTIKGDKDGASTDGYNTLYGEAGDDTITAGPGGDHIFGGPGTNTIIGGAGNDFIDDSDGTGTPGTITCGGGDANFAIPASEVHDGTCQL